MYVDMYVDMFVDINIAGKPRGWYRSRQRREGLAQPASCLR